MVGGGRQRCQRGALRSSTGSSTNAPFAVHAGEVAAVSNIGCQTHASEEEEEEEEKEEVAEEVKREEEG